MCDVSCRDSFCVKVILELKHICQLVKIVSSSRSLSLLGLAPAVSTLQDKTYLFFSRLFSAYQKAIFHQNSNDPPCATESAWNGICPPAFTDLRSAARTLWRSYICAVVKREPEYSECVNKTGISPLCTQMYCFTGFPHSVSLPLLHTRDLSLNPLQQQHNVLHQNRAAEITAAVTIDTGRNLQVHWEKMQNLT